MLECWNSGGCAGLGNLYILTVVVMIGDSNRDDIRVDFGFQHPMLLGINQTRIPPLVFCLAYHLHYPWWINYSLLDITDSWNPIVVRV